MSLKNNKKPKIFSQDEARAAAKAILQAYWKSSDLPIDPEEIGAYFNVRFVEIDTDDDVAGGIYKKSGYPPLIFVNDRDHTSEHRLTKGHELGHLYLRQVVNNERDSTYEYMDLRATLIRDDVNNAEGFANAFANELIMPQELFEQHWKQNKDFFKMSSIFGVSINAIKRRLEELGL
ncbi:MAG: ImmA/IrrE family metallo-endopeptidase [candidate division Zixibacteria bacterium]|nr:ImmA/IrrE family metallo-endopeptidase [candidate division Zixibacteria bacterium]